MLKSALHHEDRTVGRTADPGVEHPLAECSALRQALNFHGEKLCVIHNPRIQPLPPPILTVLHLLIESPGAFSSLQHDLQPELSKNELKEDEWINLLPTFSPHLENDFFSLSDVCKPFKML